MSEQKNYEQTQAQLKTSRLKTVALAIVGAVIFTAIWRALGVREVLFSYVLGASTSGAMIWLWYQRREGLQSRAKGVSGLFWDVSINGVAVGVILDADLARIELDLWTAPRAFLAQAKNVVNAISRAANLLMRDTPYALFWMAIAWAVVAPADTLDVFRAGQDYLRTASPEDLLANLAVVARAWMLVCAAGLVLNGLLTDRWYGLRNVFHDQQFQAVRIALKVPAEGHISLMARSLEDTGDTAAA